MSAHKYIQYCWLIADEYKCALSFEDVEELRKDIRAMGEETWSAWVKDNEAQLLSFLSLTPAKLAKRKDWAAPVLRRRIAVAVFHFERLRPRCLIARLAWRLVVGIDQHPNPLPTPHWK